MDIAHVVAQLLGLSNYFIRESCYAGIEICWWQDSSEKYLRIVTFVNGGKEFLYTKDIEGLPGTWHKVDYWFLYLN